MIRFEKFVLILIVLAVTLPIRQVFATTEEPVSDVRILIDVSGSMKKNDPNNLRAPALRLVIGLHGKESTIQIEKHYSILYRIKK